MCQSEKKASREVARVKTFENTDRGGEGGVLKQSFVLFVCLFLEEGPKICEYRYIYIYIYIKKSK